MRPFPPEQLAALKSLQRLWGTDGFIVIGAATVSWHLGLHWRVTKDLDLAVACHPDGFVQDLERLGWRRDRHAAHRWRLPDSSIVDVVPAHPDLVAAGQFVWPGSEVRMRLLGFRLAFADAGLAEIGGETRVRVASLRSLAVLKIAAYLDLPWDRVSDLADLAHIMAGFVAPDAEARWSDEVIRVGLAFEDVSPFVLGSQLRAVVDDPEKAVVSEFIEAAEDPGDKRQTIPRMAQRAPIAWKDPKELTKRIAAFRRGFEGK